jgi:hypothetical protein
MLNLFLLSYEVSQHKFYQLKCPRIDTATYRMSKCRRISIPARHLTLIDELLMLSLLLLVVTHKTSKHTIPRFRIWPKFLSSNLLRYTYHLP